MVSTRFQTKMATLNEVRDLILVLQKEQKESNDKIDQLLLDLKAKDDHIKSLESRIEKLESQVETFEGTDSCLRKTINLLERKCDDNEQYSRRMSLRITKIPSVKDENSEKCKEIAVSTLNKIPGVNITKSDIVRAHRTGKIVAQNKPRQMLVKFKSWEVRTDVYKKRKDLRSNQIFSDLTKRRLGLKHMAIDRANDMDNVEFVFSDMNCSLGLKLVSGDFKYFNSEDELTAILSNT